MLPQICQWYALCANVADGTTWHPTLGYVPICTRCADKHDLPVEPFLPVVND